MRRVLPALILATLALSTEVRAADHFIAGDRIRLRDTGDPSQRRAKFRAAKDLAIVPSLANDPRMLGAELEITGTGVGDGSSGVIPLAAGQWIGLGNPAGSQGYKWVDPTLSLGVRRVIFRNGVNGGKLVIVGRGPNWPYQVTQAQSTVLVRFTIDTENYCAQFPGYVQNGPGLVVGINAAAPTSCTVTCGNGVVEGTEECDDGDMMSGDGCSSTCELEDTSALCAGVPTTPGEDIDAVRVAQGLAFPNTITAPPLDPSRVFVVEKAGRIRIIKNGTLLGTPFLDINSKVIGTCQFCEQGLLGLAFHPDYENNGRFFVHYNDNSGDTVISRYEVSGDPDIADTTGLTGGETIVLQISQPFSNHNGGNIIFGSDGYLWVGMGDGGSGGDPFDYGQDDTTLLGKMLRIDIDVDVLPFRAVPPSNPNAGAGDPLGLIWAKGLRNPWRYSLDRLNGDLYIGDVGQGEVEEIDWVPGSSTGAENYGWDVFEGNNCYADPMPPSGPCPPPAGFTFPVYEYFHSSGSPTGCSVTGGFVYRGCALPDLLGTYFFSDYCNPFIRTFEISGSLATNHQDRTADLAPGGGLSIGDISSYGEDARGELYIADQGSGADGEVFKIIPE